MVFVHMADDVRFRLGNGSGNFAVKKQVGAVDPLRLAETADIMSAVDSHPVEMKITETGIGGRRRMAGQEAAAMAYIGSFFNAALYRHAAAGLRVFQPRGGVKQQAGPAVTGQVPGMIGQFRKK